MSNITQNKPATASNSFAPFLPARAVDGVNSPVNRWVSSQVPAWLAVDLQNSFWVNQWTANLMGSVGWTTNYNIKNFKLQGSNDNVNWFDIDSVSNNTANQINRSFVPKLARFLRVYISNGLIANNGVASIVDFQAFEPATAPFLSNLIPNAGALSPVFSSRTFNYNINVASTVNSIAFTPTAAQANLEIKVNGAVVASGSQSQQINLAVGATTVNITVKSTDSTMLTTYTVVITKAGAASFLSSLSIKDDSDDTVSYSPVLSNSVLSYTASISKFVASVVVIPIAADVSATVKVNGVVVPRGQSSAPITMNTGANTITILVNSTTYTIVITKQA